MKSSDHISRFLTVICAALFILLYVCLSINNRAAADDIVFIDLANGKSLYGAVAEIFTTWSGRWSAWSYLFGVLTFSDLEHLRFYIPVYHLLTLLILSYSTTEILRALVRNIFSADLGLKTAFVYSTLFIACFFYFTLDHIEAWWWLSATFYYLQGIVFLLFGIAILIQKKKNVLHYVLIAASFLYVGASFEIYILIIFTLFIICSVCYRRYMIASTSGTEYLPYITGTKVAFVSFCFSAIICFSAPGNFNRRESILRTEQQESTNLSALLQQKHVLAFGVSSLFLMLGMRVRKLSQLNVTNDRLKRFRRIAATPLLVSIFITAAFQFFILKDFSMPWRGWTFSSFSFASLCCFTFLCIGYAFQEKFASFQFGLKIALPLCTAVVFSVVLINQHGYASNYSRAYDQLIRQLVTARDLKITDNVYVEELPPSGMITPLDIDDNYIKVPLRNILGLDFKIGIKNDLP